MVRYFQIGFIIVLFCIYACYYQKSEPVFKTGIWRANLTLDIQKSIILPFNFTLKKKDSGYEIEIINADEKILLTDIKIQNDSIFIKFPIYDSEIKARIQDTVLTGSWFNYAKSDDYAIPFIAFHDQDHRFKKRASANNSVVGKWETVFNSDTDDLYKAIGKFNLNGHKLTGTFLTETGDYRFLEGITTTDSLFLSCFDGAHAFLFTAEISSDTLLKGTFWSGKHWKEPWIAHKNKNARIGNPDSLTYLTSKNNSIEFSYPNTDDVMISLSDTRYKNKLVLVQIMGTWCPNCIDEGKYLKSLYDEYSDAGLEIIAIAFEKARNSEKAKENIRKYKKSLNIPYEVLLADINSNKSKTSHQFPALNKVISYPTLLYIDKNKTVRKIHTGFSGPGTGKYYSNFVKTNQLYIESLLKAS
ncbi:MAG: TlpA family protein disulfide reductase [Bacteroidia bacterium]|nr:TlpA family protein disulfide reductase [Bacteroidia bacterium]